GMSTTHTTRSATRAGSFTRASPMRRCNANATQTVAAVIYDSWRICCRAWSLGMQSAREYLHELTAEWKNAAARHPRALAAALAIFGVLALGSLVSLTLLYNSLRRGLPGEDAIRHISEMAEATAV